MSAYDTIDRTSTWWVSVYCETPMCEPKQSIRVELGTRDERNSDGTRRIAVEYMTPDQAVDLATALLKAAGEARHGLTVSNVVATGKP